MNRRTGIPTFHQLNHSECEALLAAHHVGRLGFTFRDRVDIEPVHYVYADGTIYGRTQFGTKVEILAHHPWVAFEVDEVMSLFEWRSVVVHGQIVFPDPEGATTDREHYERGVAAFRQLVPAAFSTDDPTPARQLVFMIHVNELAGRAATMDEESMP